MKIILLPYSLVKACALTLLIALAITGCAHSPQNHFYSLNDVTGENTAHSLTTNANQKNSSTSNMTQPFFIQVLPVKVPVQVERPQMIITYGTGQVELKEQQRWSSPLANEIRSALSSELTKKLNVIDVGNLTLPKDAIVYQIIVNIERFESSLGNYAAIEAVWNIKRKAGESAQIARSVVEEPIGNGYIELVKGHRKAINQIADEIAKGVQEIATNKSFSFF